MPIQLVLTNIFIVFCTFTTFSLGLFALIKSKKKTAAIIFFLLTLSVDTYYISHYFGINASFPDQAWFAFMFNLVNIFIVIFNYHFIYEVFGQKTKERFYFLLTTYGVGIILFVFYLLNPRTFLQLPVSKMYLPYYYVPGDMYWLMRVYFIVVVVYIFYDLVRVYITSTAVEKTRVKYIFIGLAYGYSLGASALFLVYNINIDPMYSMLFGLYTIPFVYCFLKYDLLDVKVIAKRALGYAAAIICVGLVIVFLDVIGDFLHAEVPDMPYWFIPAISSFIVVGIGGLVWIKIREVDKLKYEFVTVVTHKFRTPLTYIAWSIDALKKETTPEDRDDALKSIKTASSRLAELTDLLIGLEKSEDSSYDYTFTHENLQKVVTECLDTEQVRIKEKNILLTKQFADQDIIVNVDKRRLEFALQIFIENAISYTPRDGAITLIVSKTRHHAVVKVIDTGIGVPKEEIQYLFTKFFRGKHARLVDTEGMGIGLFIARQIIAQQGGTLEVYSEGDGMGTTFTVKLPL